MSIYSHSVASYSELPKWTCKCCGFELDCKDKHGMYVVNVYSGRKLFVKAHARAKPKCEGNFAYVRGVKK